MSWTLLRRKHLDLLAQVERRLCSCDARPGGRGQ